MDEKNKFSPKAVRLQTYETYPKNGFCELGSHSFYEGWRTDEKTVDPDSGKGDI